MEHKILLMRNGTTVSREKKQYPGHQDEPLSGAGTMAVAEKVKMREIHKARLVYTSPMLRCRETALILYPHVPAVITQGLAPLDIGNYTGMTYHEMLQDKQFGLWGEANQALPLGNGEDPNQFQARCTVSFHRILQEIHKNRIENIAVFTHRGVISNIMQRFCVPRYYYKEWGVECGGGYLLSYNPEKRLVCMEREI